MRRLGVRILAVFFAVLVLSSFAGALRFVPTKGQGSFVTPAEAKLVAQRHLQWASSNIPNFEDWKRTKLSQPVIYYFPNGTQSAYEFTVLVNGKPDGFILVAAQRYMPPVLEFSKGEAPSKRLGRIGRARIKDFLIGRHRLLYYGGLSYSIDMENGKATDIYGRRVLVPKTVKLTLSPKQVARDWKAFDTKADISDVGVLSTSMLTKIIPNVPVWTEDSYWTYTRGVGDLGGASTSYPKNVGPKADPWNIWDGCTPIAAAQIIAYYEHPEIYENGYYTQEYKEYMTSLVDILHHTMGTSRDGNTPDCGSWGSDACDGIEAFASEYQKLKDEGIVSWSLVHSYDAQPTCTWGLCWWSPYITMADVVPEINQHRPILLQLDNGGKARDGQGPYGNHSVVIVGYVWDGRNVEYLVIHSGWDMGEHYLAWGNWGSDTYLVKIHPQEG